MKLILAIICCIGLLICIGCVKEQPDSSPILLPQEKPQEEPLIIVDDDIPTPVILHITDAQINNITTSAAILEFYTDHPSTANIIILAWEHEIARYTIDTKSTYHSIHLSDLQYSTLHTVIIEATGSPSVRKVLRFTTAAPIPIHPNMSSSYGGYRYPSSNNNGIITASWYNGDGTFNNNTWTMTAYPGETKQCILVIHNSLGYSVTVSLQSSLTLYPVDGYDKVLISSGNITIPNGHTGYLTVSAIANGDAPVGLYEFEFQLLY